MNKLKSLFTSRRFYVALSGLLVVVGGVYWPQFADAVGNLVLTLSAWIIGDSLRKTEITEDRKIEG